MTRHEKFVAELRAPLRKAEAARRAAEEKIRNEGLDKDNFALKEELKRNFEELFGSLPDEED